MTDQTGVRRNVPLTSSLCCCSLKIKDTGLLARFYSTHGYQDGRRTQDTLRRESLRSMDMSARETLRQRLNAFASQARKTSSIRRFEPCYRQIYPSKKRKATFKIPKKSPYIPAIYQKKTTSYRDKYSKMDLEPVKGRKLQWPPLYPSKRKDYPQPKQAEDKNQQLPPWLLPLYSCKTCHSESAHSTSEARFSGGAFRRKMEIMESIKQIRANQDVLLRRNHEKETKKDESTRFNPIKSGNAVEALKRRIDTMQDYLSAMKNMEAHRKKYHPPRNSHETDLAETPAPVKQAYARIYKTKPPTQEREMRVRKSTSVGVPGQKSPDKPLPSTSSNVTDQQSEKIQIDNNKGIHTLRKQYDEGTAQSQELESNSSIQLVEKYSTADATNNLSLGQIHRESVVLIKQPSWKKQWSFNSQTKNESITSEKKSQNPKNPKNHESIANQIPASPKRHQGGTINDISMVNQQFRNMNTRETKTVQPKTPDAWTVESLKSRINVMKIKSTDEPVMKEAEGVSLTRNGGEVKPKISQVALRSFHKEAGKHSRKVQVANTTKMRLGYQRAVSRRSFSTFRPSTSDQPTRALGYHRRTIFNMPQKVSKKRNWVNRLKRCFVLKKTKGYKLENWKEAPREIPYESEEVKYNSPAPILWKPTDLDNNLEATKQSKPAEVFKEKVNPAVLNAEQRILASISRLISTKAQSDDPELRVIDIEKKIKRAKNKVNMIPWCKRSKSTDTVQTLPQLRGSHNKPEREEPRESGYEWILKNRDIVEKLKGQSRAAAGKSLVPIEVKNAIDQYKLPLKAEISRYRKKMDQKCSENFCMYSTSKRWYSTCFAGRHRGILSCSDVIMVNTRGIKTTESQKENAIPGKFLDRRTRSDIVLGPNVRRYNQTVSNKPRKIDEKNEDPEEEKRPKRWAWKVPNKTRAFTPKTTTLTFPCKTMGTRMSEMSPCALKKQVEDLKRLIKKAREEVSGKTDELPIDLQSRDKYEARLKRVIKAAQNNAQKMSLVEPKYTSENNMMANKTSSGKRNSSQPIIPYNTRKSDHPKNKPEVSVLKSLFKKTTGEPNSPTDEILYRNNITSLPALATNKKSEKSTSRVYLKLKSLVDAVRNKSAMVDPIIDVKLLPSKSLKGSLSVDAISGCVAEKCGKPRDTKKQENVNEEPTSPVKVELLAHKTPAPSNTIQLWKGESKPNEFNSVNDKEPTYGELLTLFIKAKGLFYYQPSEEEKTIDGKSQITELQKNSDISINKNTLPQNEMTKNWLSIREDVSMAAKAVSELKKYPQKGLEALSQAGSHLFTAQQKAAGIDNFSENLMTKSKMIPFELLKSEPKITSCDHLWTTAPVKVLEDEDLCRNPSLQTNPINENQSASQSNIESTKPSTNRETCSSTGNDCLVSRTKSWQPESTPGPLESPQKSVSVEQSKLLFQKPMMALESLTKNFGSTVGRSLFGKADESPNNSEPEAAVSSETSCTDQDKKTGDVLNPPGDSNSSSLEMEHSHDINRQSQSTLAGNVTSNCSHVTDDIAALQNTTISNSNKETSKPGIKDEYVQDCIESFRPLEESVETYENYYRNYFAEDILSGYEHLHQVYEDLNKLHNVGQYQNLPNPFKMGTEAVKEASCQLTNDINTSTSTSQTTREDTKTPIMTASGTITDLESHGSVEGQSDGQTRATETKLDETSSQHGPTAMTTSGTQDPTTSCGISELGVSNNRQTNFWLQETNIPADAIMKESRQSESQQSTKELSLNTEESGDPPTDVTCSAETYIDSLGNIREEIQTQESQLVRIDTPSSLENSSMQVSKDTQQQFGGCTSKEEGTANVETLLSQDPTLNPEVVKKLKLPVILTEDCHTEKNWYTTFYSGHHQNR